ncbi:hypothetical protein [Crossiella cryophila]|uniref:Tetratricopeptide (TPR) repeat protein n=1 Tax=Crossiella cryophila TaxID=43355 RepID=A0A7W7CGN4_9PSEU|nr:hypothetical protein [Crossiella cryophila]MBB4679428.1 tetratricopeptide (TPR) repeat protein [Crossiella cryophila]
MASQNIGQVVKVYRKESKPPVSQMLLGEALGGLSQSQVSRLESEGSYKPVRELQSIAVMIGMPWEIAWFAPPPQLQRGMSAQAPWGASNMDFSGFRNCSPTSTDVAMFSQREDELQQKTEALDHLTARSARLPRRAAEYDPENLKHFVSIRTTLVRADALMGPRTAMSYVTQEVRNLSALVKTVPEALRPGIYEVAAAFAELAGWLADDLGNPKDGAEWSNTALRWAHAANSPELVAYVLARQAQQAASGGEHADAVALAKSAAATGGVPGRVAAMALQQQARGHAAEGDERAMMRALEMAHQARTSKSSSPSGRFDLANYCTLPYLHSHEGACWTALGQYDRAVAAYDEALAHWSPDYRREEGLLLAQKAGALAAGGEAEYAAATARQSLNLMESTGSARTLAVLLEVDKVLDKIPTKDGEVALFQHELTTRRPAQLNTPKDSPPDDRSHPH